MLAAKFIKQLYAVVMKWPLIHYQWRITVERGLRPRWTVNFTDSVTLVSWPLNILIFEISF